MFYGKINYVQCSIAMPKKKSRGYQLVIMYSFLWKKMACLQMVSHDLTMTDRVLRRKLWAPRPDIKFYLHSGPFPYSKHIRNMNISTPYESQSSSISYPPHEIPIPHVWWLLLDLPQKLKRQVVACWWNCCARRAIWPESSVIAVWHGHQMMGTRNDG